MALFAKSGHWIPIRHVYEYTKKELNVCYEDDEGGDRVDLVEEQLLDPAGRVRQCRLRLWRAVTQERHADALLRKSSGI